MTRFDKKIDRVVWSMILLLPIFVYFVTAFHSSTPLVFADIIASFKFDYIYNILTNIFIGDYSLPLPLCSYLSYFCVVEIAHIFVDFVCFIPRWCHDFLGGFYEKKY